MKVAQPKSVTGDYGTTWVIRLNVKDKSGQLSYIGIWEGHPKYNTISCGEVLAFKNLVVTNFPKVKPHWLKTARNTIIVGMYGVILKLRILNSFGVF